MLAHLIHAFLYIFLSVFPDPAVFIFRIHVGLIDYSHVFVSKHSGLAGRKLCSSECSNQMAYGKSLYCLHRFTL